jgi:hypothetical protein
MFQVSIPGAVQWNYVIMTTPERELTCQKVAEKVAYLDICLLFLDYTLNTLNALCLAPKMLSMGLFGFNCCHESIAQQAFLVVFGCFFGAYNDDGAACQVCCEHNMFGG